jgi:hypothetical protein
MPTLLSLYRLPWLLAAALSVVAILAGCQTDAPAQQYTYGPTSQTGVLIPTDISLVKRGTHVLQVDAKDMYYLESKTENLQEYAGQTVFVEGTLEPNTHQKYLPVLVVTRIAGKDRPAQPHEWRIPALGITLTTPDTWKADINNDIVSFSADGSGQTILTVTKKEGTTMPQGDAIYVDGLRGVRVRDRVSGLQDVYVSDGKSVIRMHFTPDESQVMDENQLRLFTDMFDDVVQSLRLGIGGSTSVTPANGSGGVGMPCGGSAGILCPAGYYCDVYDAESNIGKCKPM